MGYLLEIKVAADGIPSARKEIWYSKSDRTKFVA